MYLNPTTTGLILLGASSYDYFPKQNLRAFRNAYDEVKEYFQCPIFGLGLQDRMILDVFNQDLQANFVVHRIEEFLQSRLITDLFLYICSHGVADGERLKIYLKISGHQSGHEAPRSTDVTNWETYADFNTIMSKLDSLEACRRVFCIVDCCASGVVHKNRLHWERHDLEFHDVMNPLDVRGVTIITSNNEKAPGVAVAGDQLPGIDLPLFTHVLLELLREGVPEQDADRLSFKHLHALACDRIPKLIEEINRSHQGARPIVSQDQLPACMPSVSDHYVHEEENRFSLLSRYPVFPNNHKHHMWNRYRERKVEAYYSTKRRMYDRIYELYDKVDELSDRNEVLENTIQSELERQQAIQNELDHLRQEHGEMQNIVGAKVDRIESLKEDVGYLEKRKGEMENNDRELRRHNEVLSNRLRQWKRATILAACVAAFLFVLLVT